MPNNESAGIYQKGIHLVETYYPFWAVLVLLWAAFHFFYKLGDIPVWDWDEARYATNAYEMQQNHDYGICTYNHEIDDWNKKPFLGPWCIVAGYRLFGFSIFGMRFYSALSCLALILLLVWLLPKVIGKGPSLLAAVALVLTPPFLFLHGARNGDYCALFCLFYSLFLICLYKAEEKGPFFPLAGLCAGLGFLVYSFHAALMLVVAAFYLLLTGLARKISIGSYMGSTLCGLLPVAGWALWRGSYPGGIKFLTEMFTYDVVSHTIQPVEGHVGGMDFYFSDLSAQHFIMGLYFLLALFLYFSVAGFKLDFKDKALTLASLGVLVPFVLYSIARTKLGWYLDPIYPPLALLTGWLTFRILGDAAFRPIGKGLLLFLLAVALIRSENIILKAILHPQSKPSQSLLAELAKTPHAPGTDILGQGWSQADRFMAEVVCGLNPVEYKDLGEVTNQHGYLMLEKDLKNEDEKFVQDHRLEVVLQNDDWMLVKL